MTNALYNTYASTADLNRSPEELKQKRSTRYVPVYEPILTNSIQAILELTESCFARIDDDISLENMTILCREKPETQLDHCGMQYVPIRICGCDADGQKSWLRPVYGQFADRFGLDDIQTVFEENAAIFQDFRIYAVDKCGSIVDMNKVLFFIRRPITRDLFLAMREGGGIKAWDDRNAGSD
jgi:hypothetical protein